MLIRLYLCPPQALLIVRCTEAGIRKAAEEVKKGAVIVFPTDTVYGIGCNPYDVEAVQRVIEIKMREQKPLPVLCSSLENAKKLVRFNRKSLELARKFWPGPLTIVAEIIDKKLPKNLTLGSNMLGVRVPNNKSALKLIELSGGFLVGTSANKAGLKPPNSAEEVKSVLTPEYDILLDGGETALKVESTVIEAINDKIKMLRERAIPKEALGI
jgi:L-threonylcarbamoyladenylate synthase